MKLFVTGATGYIGDRLARAALAKGHEVVAACRRRPELPLTWIPYELTSPAEIPIPRGVDAVVHLAAITNLEAMDPDTELEAARRLLAAARHVGARFLFVSSQTAREDAPTAYGRCKWIIEQEVLAAGGLVLRPGQVYGGPERALFGMLMDSVRRMPVIPAFLPAPRVQPVHVDDLAAALLSAAGAREIISTVLCIGAIEPVSFTYFLRCIAAGRLRRFRPAVPVPAVLIPIAGVLAPRHAAIAQLKSLFALPPMRTEADLKRLGIVLRSLQSGMTRSGDTRRRELIREGRVFLVYVLKTRPSRAVLRRYVRAVESLRDGRALPLPGSVLHMPLGMLLLDTRATRSAPRGEEFFWRLHAAVAISEASVQGAARFLAVGEATGTLSAAWRMMRAGSQELVARVLRCGITPVLKVRWRNHGLVP